MLVLKTRQMHALPLSAIALTLSLAAALCTGEAEAFKQTTDQEQTAKVDAPAAPSLSNASQIDFMVNNA